MYAAYMASLLFLILNNCVIIFLNEYLYLISDYQLLFTHFGPVPDNLSHSVCTVLRKHALN